MNKKLLSIIAVCILLVCCTSVFVGCQTPQEEYTVDFYMPDGTPALAAASVLNQYSFGKSTTNFNIVKADQISGAFSAGADLAIMPTIVAAKLYTNGAQVKLVSTNVFGNLFIVGVNTTVASPADMVGKVLYVTVGTTLNLTKYILEQNDVSWAEGSEPQEGKVVFCSKADGSEILPLLKQAGQNEALAVLGEPQVTKAKSMINGLKTVIDLQSEWKTITGFEGYPQASLVATAEFCQNHADYIKNLLTEMEKNATFLADNLSELPALFTRYESSLGGMTFDETTIANCNLRVERAKNVKNSVKDYLQRLATAVDDNFFFEV